MALRKIGKKWHIYYRDVNQQQHSTATGETNKKNALIKEKIWMQQLNSQKKRLRLGMAGNLPPAEKSALNFSPSKSKRFTFPEAFDVYRRHVDEVPENTLPNWLRMVERLKVKYVDQLTPQLAYQYLLDHYGNTAGKTFNNNKNSINAVFKKILIPCGLSSSPFANVPNRPNKGDHQRALSDEEIIKIINAAIPIWRAAVIISYWTGFRQESCFRLGPDHIKNDIITMMPGKTARFNRAVQIPLHPQLKYFLNSLPASSDDTFLGFDQRKRNGGAFTSYFGNLLERLDIHDNEKGIAVFNSIRNNFIDRCRASTEIPDYAIRGMVGQVEEETTDLYSQEITSAMPLIYFPELQYKTISQ